MTFLSNPKYIHYIYSTGASIVVVSRDFIPAHEIKCTLIRVDDPYQSFATLLEIFSNMQAGKREISSLAFISASAVTGKDLSVGAFTYVADHGKVRDW